MSAGTRARYRAEYAGLLALRGVFRNLPPERAVALGARMGDAWVAAGAPRLGDALRNLELAFPDWDEARRREVLRGCLRNLGRSIAEVFLLQGRHRETLLAGLSVEGLEHYEAAKARSESGGVLILTAHFGSWELCGAAMGERGYPLSVVHHAVGNPWLDAMVSGWRRRSGVEELELGSAGIGVLRALSRGRLVCVLLDQDARRGEGVFAPFLGHPACTRSGPAVLALRRGVPVVPVFVFRDGASPRHLVSVRPALGIEPLAADAGPEEQAEATVRAATLMNAAIEGAIHQAPDHWLWPHRRFRTRPPGMPSLYRLSDR